MAEIRELGIRPDGKKLRGYSIKFRAIDECWSEYELDDGTRIRVRQTLLKAYRLVDDNDQDLFDELGDPEVYVNGSMAIAAFRAVETS